VPLRSEVFRRFPVVRGVIVVLFANPLCVAHFCYENFTIRTLCVNLDDWGVALALAPGVRYSLALGVVGRLGRMPAARPSSSLGSGEDSARATARGLGLRRCRLGLFLRLLRLPLVWCRLRSRLLRSCRPSACSRTIRSCSR
jgi:hypothetical protein